MSGTFAADGTLVAAGANGWALTAGQALTVIAVASGRRLGAAPALHVRGAEVRRAQLDRRHARCCCSSRRSGSPASVQHPDTPFWVFLLSRRTAGLGGGNFASSMANITFFYPEQEKGWALGLNAAGGNLGVASSSCSCRSSIVAGGLARGTGPA